MVGDTNIINLMIIERLNCKIKRKMEANESGFKMICRSEWNPSRNEIQKASIMSGHPPINSPSPLSCQTQMTLFKY